MIKYSHTLHNNNPINKIYQKYSYIIIKFLILMISSHTQYNSNCVLCARSRFLVPINVSVCLIN